MKKKKQYDYYRQACLASEVFDGPALKRILRRLVRNSVAKALDGDDGYGEHIKVKLAKIIAKELVP